MVNGTILTFVFLFVSCLEFAVGLQEESNMRITGGQNATAGQFPYQVSIRSLKANPKNWHHACGGSILTSKWILTAGHCFWLPPNNPELYYVVVGSVLLSSGGVKHQVSRIKMYENYKYDIALVELAVEIQFSDNVKPVQLETEDVGVVDSVLAGWGKLYANGPSPDNLQFILLKTIDLQVCRSLVYPDEVLDSQICTLSPMGMGACMGDSGGPLVAGGKQIGIVVSHYACGDDRPVFYTRVSSFIEWIQTNMKL